MEFRRSILSLLLPLLYLFILVSAEGVDRQKGEFIDPVLNGEGKCTKARSLSDGCNTCVCKEGGMLHCTDNKCPQDVEVHDAESLNEQDQRKEPLMTLEGKCLKTRSFSDGCNTCVCQKGGVLLCTDIKCPQKEEAHEVSAESLLKDKSMESYLNHKGRCIKEGSFFDGCSRCFCQKGHKPHCSYKKCLQKREASDGKITPGGRCTPGAKWKLDECNNCTCTHTGYASCTLNECSPKKKGKRSTKNSKVNQPGRCNPGDKWQLDECNSCVCTHTGYASCTLNDCKDKKRGKRTASIGKPSGNSGNECRAGHSWKENCNSCFCSERGIAMCTDMACPTPNPRPLELTKSKDR